jgi:hypothetical protein
MNRLRKKIRKTISFTITSKNKIGINLMKETKDLFNEMYKSLKRKIKHLRRWNDLPCSWISRINVVKMAILPKAIYMFKAIPKFQVHFFNRDRKINPKVHIETQKDLEWPKQF